MLSVDQIERVEKFVDYHGSENQMIKCIEAMAELTKEITGVLLHPFGFTNGKQEDRLANELADVMITIEQLNYIAKLEFGTGFVECKIEEKIARHEKFLEEVI